LSRASAAGYTSGPRVSGDI